MGQSKPVLVLPTYGCFYWITSWLFFITLLISAFYNNPWTQIVLKVKYELFLLFEVNVMLWMKIKLNFLNETFFYYYYMLINRTDWKQPNLSVIGIARCQEVYIVKSLFWIENVIDAQKLFAQISLWQFIIPRWSPLTA